MKLAFSFLSLKVSAIIINLTFFNAYFLFNVEFSGALLVKLSDESSRGSCSDYPGEIPGSWTW